MALIKFFSNSLFSQNLVPNFSFENHSSCPNGMSEIYFALPWLSPTNATPDLYDSCAIPSSDVSVPNNFEGEQKPYSGKAYAGVIEFIVSGWREYIQAQLTDTLEAGKLYCIRFFVSLAGNSDYATTGPQIYFSDTIIGSSSVGALPFSPQIENSTTIISDTTNWVLISGYYTADGGEKFITIGNFYDNANTQFDTVGNHNNPVAYYYIDHISVMECDTADTTHYPIYVYYNLFPSPSDGNFHLTGNFPSETKLHIYNMLGQEVTEPIALPEGNNDVPVFTSLAEGVYIIRILQEKNIFYTSKLEIYN